MFQSIIQRASKIRMASAGALCILKSEEEDTFLCSVHDVVEGNAEEFASPSSHNITFSPVDFSASATSSTLLEGGC
eukprot:scaffold9786_cov191-Skeletonema_marinoi.AAC.1